MKAGSSNEVSIGKALLTHEFKKSGSSTRNVQYVGLADENEKALEGKMESLSINESLPG